MSIKVYRVKKLFNGYASVRDYVVRRCQATGCDLRIQFGDDFMLIPHDELANKKKQLINTLYRSRWGDRQYQLVDFKWSPTKEAK